MAEGDYPGGRTPWENFEVPQLAGHLTENLGRAWGQARAWYNTADMAAGYLDTLRRLRENLVKVWPPDRSPAAKAYVDRLDSLIASVDDVRDAAAGTGEALAGVLSSLEGARPQMDRWLAEWGPQEDPGSNLADGSQDQSRRVELNRKAQQHMRELDDAVFPYQSRMRAPQPWEPPPVVGDDPGDPSGGSGGSAGGAGSGGGSARDWSVRPPDIPPVPPLADGGAGSGPAGGLPPAAGPVLTGGPGPGGVPAPGDMPVGAGPVPGSAPGSVPSGSWWVDTPQGRVLRAGAVIGMPPPPAAGSPGADGARPGGRPSGSASSAGAGEPGGAEERAGSGMLGGAPYGGAGRAGRDRRGRRSEAYVEWEVRKGWPPVLEPGPEPTHDPGPGVIGIDR